MLKDTPGLCTLLLEIKIEECSGWHRTRLASELWGSAHGEVNGHPPWPHVTLYTGCRYVRPCCVHDCFSLCAGPAAKPKQEEPSHVEKERDPCSESQEWASHKFIQASDFSFPKVPHVFVFSNVSRCAKYLFPFSTFLDSLTSDDFQCIFGIFAGLICHCLQSHHLRAEQAIRDSSTCGHLV